MSERDALRRVIFYLFYDPRGQVDDYVTHKLKSLRESADYIFVVANSVLTPEGRSKLESVADEVYARENVGFDVWAYKEAMEVFGRDRLLEFDELVLMNYTFFGPIYPFTEVFERMDRTGCEFWGISAHKAVQGDPVTGEGTFPFHIQSHWIAVRRPMFRSLEFQQYWDTMPMITSYDGSIKHHEARFTAHFAAKGFTYAVAFPAENYPGNHPIFENSQMMLDDRCPIVKRRIFFHDPLYLERNAILGKRVMQRIEKTDYPTDLIWKNVARSAEPRTLYTNFSLLEVVSDVDSGFVPDPVPRVAVLAHIYYEDMVDEIMSYVRHIPVPFDLIVTTSSAQKKSVILEALKRYDISQVDVRVVEQNRGRDMSALFIGCRDILQSDDYDLVCRVHSKKSPQDSWNSADLFKHHMFDNLLNTRPYVEGILRLFQENATLGMVYPPIVNIGYPTLGHSWFFNRGPAEELAAELGIEIPFDRTTPLSPYGSMFWARPQAIRRMVDHDFKWTDYPLEGDYADGSLSHVQERILGYCALTDGYHVRCVINSDWAEINYTFLEYKLQLLSSRLPHYTQDQVDYLERMQTGQPILRALKETVDQRMPLVGKAARPAYRAARAVYRRGRSPRNGTQA